MNGPDLSTTSNPVMGAAMFYGVPSQASYLAADLVLSVVAPDRNVWPMGHYWHVWAVAVGEACVGRPVFEAFYDALTDYFIAKYPVAP
jgi:hypothetical protein